MKNLLPVRLAEGHVCARTDAGHKVHVCRCGVTWNQAGQTFREWKASR